MALSLKDPETDRLAREVARLTGESITEAIRTALAQRLRRERLVRGDVGDLRKALSRLAKKGASLPDRDTRTADEITDDLWR